MSQPLPSLSGAVTTAGGGVWSVPLRRAAQDVVTARFLAPALFDASSTSSSTSSSKTSSSASSAPPRNQRRFTLAADHVEMAKKLSNCHSYLYTGEIQLGTPAQSFTVGLDTSSFDLWVVGDQCDETCGGTSSSSFSWRRRYSAANSTTMQNVTEEEKKYDEFFSDMEYVSVHLVSINNCWMSRSSHICELPFHCCFFLRTPLSSWRVSTCGMYWISAMI
jgi:Eukaryotic aspartyl protease